MQRAKFAMAFNIGSTNEERNEAFHMYQKAFAATKLCFFLLLSMELFLKKGKALFLFL